MFTNMIRLYGIHSDIMKKYCPDKQGENNISFTINDNEGKDRKVCLFDSMLQCYMTAAMVGIIKKTSSPVDKSNSSYASIFAEILVKPKNRKLLERIYQHMVLTENNDLEPDSKIKMAFSVDKNNLDIDGEARLEGYVRGGLEIIDSYFSKCQTYEDLAQTVFKFLEEFKI